MVLIFIAADHSIGHERVTHQHMQGVVAFHKEWRTKNSEDCAHGRGRKLMKRQAWSWSNYHGNWSLRDLKLFRNL